MWFKRRNSTDVKQELSFVDHLEELRGVIVRSLAAVFIFAIIVFFKVEWIFDNIILGPTHSHFLTYKMLCKLGQYLNLQDQMCMQNITIKFQSNKMSSQFFMSFSISFVAGFILAFPYIIYNLWNFIKPALKPQEIKKINKIVIYISILFFFGVLFAYYIIMPYTVNFFAGYTLSPLIENIFLISDYLDILLQLTLGTGLIFQLPLVIYFLSKLDIVTSTMLKKYRKYAVVIILFLAAIITPPDVISQLIVTIPLWLLYELGINIASKQEQKK